MSHEDELRRQLYQSYKNRAILYVLFYEEFAAELGDEKTEALMKRAIERRGRQLGAQFAKFAPSNLAGLCRAFVDGIPDEGRMFEPEVQQCTEDELDIRFSRCPLRDAWREMGLSEERIAQMCRIAARIDNGTFEGAGFRFSADTWKPGAGGCCYLHIRPGDASAAGGNAG